VIAETVHFWPETTLKQRIRISEIVASAEI